MNSTLGIVIGITAAIIVVVLAISNMRTSIEVRENEVIFKSPLSSKRYRIIEVMESGVPVNSVVKTRITGINLPSKKIGKFRTKYGTATVYCTTPYCVVLKTDKGIVILDEALFKGEEQ